MITHSVLAQISDNDQYHYGFNGQFKDNEWAGIGNHNSVLYWEYDTRTARRGNLDPKDQISVSNYAVFGLNPILYNDIFGDEKGDAIKEDDAKGEKGTIAPNGGMRNGDGSISGGISACRGCGANGEDTWGMPDEIPFGGSGSMNIREAAYKDVGKNDESRRRADLANQAAMGWMGTLAAAPVVGYTAVVTSPTWGPWAVNNLLLTSGRIWAPNVAGGAGDLVFQLATKDVEDVNFFSVASNTFLGPAPSAFIGGTANISYNSLTDAKKPIFSMPHDAKGFTNIGLGTLSNYGAGELGKLLGVPHIRIGTVSAPNVFGPSLDMMSNAAGNAASENAANAVFPEK